MRWKFWEKDAPAAAPQQEFHWPTDSYESARLLAGMFANREMAPFSQWHAPDVKLTADIEQVAEFGAIGLMLAHWFWAFRDRHGDIAAQMARDEFCLTLDDLGGGVGTMTDNLIGIADRARRSYVERPAEQNRVTVGDKTVELPFHWFCAIAMLTQMADSPYFGKGSDVAMKDDDMSVAQCLSHGLENAEPIWDLMISAIGPFNPTAYPRWRWSSKPGAHERHLQRRHGNPLFEPDRRAVATADVYYARVKDVQRLQEIRRGVSAVYEDIKKGDLDIDWHTQLNGLRVRLDELADRLDAVGGDTDTLASTIASLREHVIETWRSALGNNPESIAKLDDAEATHKRSRALWCTWASQVQGDDSPIPRSEVAASLLTESPEDIRKAAAVLDASEGIVQMRQTGLQLVLRALAECHEVPDHRVKLAILGVAI